MGRGRLITFEGIEGCGKSHQLGRTSRFLDQLGIAHIRTLEPGGTAFGRELRSILLSSSGAPRTPKSELLLYLADRLQHLDEVIRPHLQKQIWVLSDRYHDATRAYQGYARSIGLEWVDALADDLEILRPDLTIILDLPVEVGLQRARARNAEQRDDMARFENEELDFHRRVREGYLLLAEKEPERICVLDGRGTPDEVFCRVRAVVKERLKNRWS